MSARIPAQVLLLLLLSLLGGCALTQQVFGPAANPEAARQHEFLADLQLRAGRPDLAAAGYEKARSLNPDAPGLPQKLGRALLRLERQDEALEAFQLALAKNPDEAAALRGAGECLLRLERWAEAEDLLRRSLAQAPQSWRGRCLLGMALDASGRHAEAVREYEAALAAPGSEKGRLEILNNLALAQAQAGDAEAGARTLVRALETGQAPERLVNNLGLLLSRLGRNDEALAAFRLSGDDPRALNNMGFALLLSGEAGAALTLFEKALEASPGYYGQADENLMRATLAASSEPEPFRLGAGRARASLLGQDAQPMR